MADVFISYATEDRHRVRPLAEALQGRGFSVWWDRTQAAGQDYAKVIERELRSAKAVIVPWTEVSTMSTFVRAEAVRARADGRLVTVLLDPVQPPADFAQIKSDNFTRWSGDRDAEEIRVLEDVLRAKIAARENDGAAQARRRGVMGRLRLVALLLVIAGVAGFAAFGSHVITPAVSPPPAPPRDMRAELLQGLSSGPLSSAQAAQLADLLKPQILPSPAEGQPDTIVQDSYARTFTAAVQHADLQVRAAAAQLARAETRATGLQALVTYAQAHPADPARDQLYLLSGAVGEANAAPQSTETLEAAANLSPRDPAGWRLLALSYHRANQGPQADGATAVADALAAANPEPGLQQTLPRLSPATGAPVASMLGDLAAARGDFSAASARYALAYQLRERLVAQAPNSAPARELSADAQRLVGALDRSGRTREACDRLLQAQQSHGVAAPDQDLLGRCQSQFHTALNTQVELAPSLQRAQAQQVAMPAPAP